jgi:hypothetical protein
VVVIAAAVDQHGRFCRMRLFTSAHGDACRRRPSTFARAMPRSHSSSSIATSPPACLVCGASGLARASRRVTRMHGAVPSSKLWDSFACAEPFDIRGGGACHALKTTW